MRAEDKIMEVDQTDERAQGREGGRGLLTVYACKVLSLKNQSVRLWLVLSRELASPGRSLVP